LQAVFGCVAALLGIGLLIAFFALGPTFLVPYLTVNNVRAGTLVSMATLGCIAVFCRYGLKRRDVRFAGALLYPLGSALFLIFSIFFRNLAVEDYAKKYVGHGVQPGNGFDLLSLLFILLAVGALVFGVRSALGLPGLGYLFGPADGSKNK
jgi:hypothetical protein